MWLGVEGQSLLWVGKDQSACCCQDLRLVHFFFFLSMIHITKQPERSKGETYLALNHEDYGVGSESCAGAKQPVEVGIVGVADTKVAWVCTHWNQILILKGKISFIKKIVQANPLLVGIRRPRSLTRSQVAHVALGSFSPQPALYPRINNPPCGAAPNSSLASLPYLFVTWIFILV